MQKDVGYGTLHSQQSMQRGDAKLQTAARLQWIDCICFGPAVRNGIGEGTVPYPRSDFSKYVGSGTLP